MTRENPVPDFTPPRSGGTYTVQSDRSLVKDSAPPAPSPSPSPSPSPAPSPAP